jgi:HlyD family secretion protein
MFCWCSAAPLLKAMAVMSLTSRDGIAVRTPIVLGATSLHAVEIRSGLKAGDKIIISGTELFEKNERITINQ